jgi:GWxTD domain-containing protein
VKNSSTSSAVRNTFRNLFLLLACVVLAVPPAQAAGKKLKSYDREMLIQPFLGPGYAEWLIGPIARLVTREEADEYLTLGSDEEAQAFIDEFWARRDSNGEVAGNPQRELYEERAEEADKQFSEAHIRGRNTDRGTLFVLYGPPEEVDYDIAQWPDGPPLILWKYSKDAEVGLDGEKPSRLYRLIRLEDLTVFYEEKMRRDALRQQQVRPPRLPRN